MDDLREQERGLRRRLRRLDEEITELQSREPTAGLRERERNLMRARQKLADELGQVQQEIRDEIGDALARGVPTEDGAVFDGGASFLGARGEVYDDRRTTPARDAGYKTIERYWKSGDLTRQDADVLDRLAHHPADHTALTLATWQQSATRTTSRRSGR
jgi:predicted transcriptional regulator